MAGAHSALLLSICSLLSILGYSSTRYNILLMFGARRTVYVQCILRGVLILMSVIGSSHVFAMHAKRYKVTPEQNGAMTKASNPQSKGPSDVTDHSPGKVTESTTTAAAMLGTVTMEMKFTLGNESPNVTLEPLVTVFSSPSFKKEDQYKAFLKVEPISDKTIQQANSPFVRVTVYESRIGHKQMWQIYENVTPDWMNASQKREIDTLEAYEFFADGKETAGLKTQGYIFSHGVDQAGVGSDKPSINKLRISHVLGELVSLAKKIEKKEKTFRDLEALAADKKAMWSELIVDDYVGTPLRKMNLLMVKVPAGASASSLNVSDAGDLFEEESQYHLVAVEYIAKSQRGGVPERCWDVIRGKESYLLSEGESDSQVSTGFRSKEELTAKFQELTVLNMSHRGGTVGVTNSASITNDAGDVSTFLSHQHDQSLASGSGIKYSDK